MMEREVVAVVRTKSEEWIKFLGTAGARFVMIRQLRASGGLWIRAGGVNCLVDPGPGSLLRCAASRPKLDPTQLDGVILTHRHLDHSNDINVMAEAMTEGGFKKRGIIFLPEDALTPDPILLKHARGYLERIEFLRENGSYKIGHFSFLTSPKHRHPCQTYGLKFRVKDTTVAILTDTAYSEDLLSFYRADTLIINVVFFQPHPGVAHLCLDDARQIIQKLRPQKAILTHFGMSMLRAKPHVLAQQLSWETGLNVVAATDGMTVSF